MSEFYDVQQFIEQTKQVVEPAQLSRILGDAAETFGFHYFALVHHHIDLVTAKSDTIQLYNYPEAWVGTIIERGYFSDDPMHAACQKSTAGFLWSDIAKIIELSSRQKEILLAAGCNGMGEGFTIPAHIPGDFNGSCSFGARFGRAIAPTAIPAAHYVGSFAFEAARRIIQRQATKRAPLASVDKPPALSRRQFDCVVLAARGKSDVDIATLLGLSVPTVHQHMETAKRRYNAATRMQLVVRALYNSQLAFVDILP